VEVCGGGDDIEKREREGEREWTTINEKEITIQNRKLELNQIELNLKNVESDQIGLKPWRVYCRDNQTDLFLLRTVGILYHIRIGY